MHKDYQKFKKYQNNTFRIAELVFFENKTDDKHLFSSKIIFKYVFHLTFSYFQIPISKTQQTQVNAKTNTTPLSAISMSGGTNEQNVLFYMKSMKQKYHGWSQWHKGIS